MSGKAVLCVCVLRHVLVLEVHWSRRHEGKLWQAHAGRDVSEMRFSGICLSVFACVFRSIRFLFEDRILNYLP